MAASNTNSEIIPRKIAVVGTGIAGLSAAWLLSNKHEVTIYEKENRLGGHSNTVDVTSEGACIPIDTGFIVYNEPNYPNLTALFDYLNVTTSPSHMSFSVSINRGKFEYAGNFGGLFARPLNAISPRFWNMVSDIRRFYSEAPDLLGQSEIPHLSLGEYLDLNNYSEPFVRDHLLPMGAAIWSSPSDEMRNYPLEAFLRFYVNHSLLKFRKRPDWRTVVGGSRSYVERLRSNMSSTVQSGCCITSVRRTPVGAVITDQFGREENFDAVVLATHADQAFSILSDTDHAERSLLQQFKYSKNRAVLHTDSTLMPKRRRAWSSWNYVRNSDVEDNSVCVTYWMNKLQRLDTDKNYFVTLNPSREPHPGSIEAEFEYDHPMFNLSALSAQKKISQIQGVRNTWFCGSYFGYGFHEDALQAGLAVAEDIGGVRRPWNVANESGRINLRQPGEQSLERAA
ncbi:MAG: NAD/FAD-binding protein [Rhodospirillaceae bacterium]|nr:NAD/FAD-binding protein [Rhodospirillaceae bacterium]